MRWYIFILTALTIIFIGTAPRFSLLVLFEEISGDLDLNLVQVGAVWGMDSLAGFFMSLPGGLLLDRLGIKRSAIIVCILGGILCASRGLSNDFAGLATTTLIYGLFAAVTIPLAPKVVAIWFGGKHVGLFNAILFVVLVLGQMLGTRFSATVFSPLLGGWRNVLFAFGLPPVLIGLLWFSIKDISRSESAIKHSLSAFKETFFKAIRIKELWFLGLILFAQLGSSLAVNSYLPLYLRNIGWSADRADMMFTMMLGAGAAGIIPVALISDRLRARKLILGLAMVFATLSLGLMTIVQSTIGITILLVINGILRATVAPLLNTLLIELRDVRTEYVGTAVGVMYTIGMVGGFVLSPLGNSFAGIGVGAPFAFWSILSALSITALLFVREKKENPSYL